MRASLTIGGACLALLWAGNAVAADKNAADADASAEAEVEAPKRPWSVGASVTFSRLVVGDEDPENDMALVYEATASGKYEGVTGFIAGGMLEQFSEEEGESPFELQDTRIGAAYGTPVAVGEDLELGIMHQLQLFLPTSQASQRRDLIMAPMATVTFSMEVIEGLGVSLVPHFRYRFHGEAETHGGGGNVQFDTGAHLGVDYTLALGDFGEVTAGLSGGSVWVHKYDARTDAELQEEIDRFDIGSARPSLSNDTDQNFQTYDYEVHVAYTPLKYATLTVAMEQGGGVLRSGVVNTFLFHRDETQLVVSLSGRY